MVSTASLDLDLTNFILGGLPRYKGGTLAQDAERATALAQYTVLAYDADAGKWNPYTDVDSILGAHKPRGIYMGADIAAATIVAGDVTIPAGGILIGGSAVKIDRNKLVFDGDTLALDDTISGVNFAELATQFAALVESVNAMIDIFDAHVHSGITAGAANSGAPTTTMTDADAVLDDAERIDTTIEDSLRELNIYCGDVVDASDD